MGIISAFMLIAATSVAGIYTALYASSHKDKMLPFNYESYLVTALIISSAAVWAAFFDMPLGEYITDAAFAVIWTSFVILALEKFYNFIQETFYPPPVVEEPETEVIPEPEPQVAEEPEPVKQKPTIPEALRTQHHHIVAGTGHGKTTLLKSMILKDVANDHSVVVIDSQNDVINELATKIPADKMILVDPSHCPPALNLFQTDTSSELFEYIFSALDAQMTSKQAVAYRFISQLVVSSGGNIHTMRAILETPDAWREYSAHIGETAKSFFTNEYSSRQFNETRQQILRRLYTVLENETMERMLGATNNVINMSDALDKGKVVLVSTDKANLKQTNTSLLGRIFIAQVMNAVMSRGSYRKRTYLYIDEFQDYAEDSHVLFNLFEQARKYELGLVVAHQYLGQLPQQLQQSIASNTAIKMAGGVSADDARKLANQMHTEPYMIDTQPKGTFLAWARGGGLVEYEVDIAEVNNATTFSNLSAIRDRMRREYGPEKKKPRTLNFEPSKRVKLKIRSEDPGNPEKSDW